MSTALEALANKVTSLPPKDRAYLAEKLLASLEDFTLEQEWIEEAKRRRDEVRSGRVGPIPSEEVYREIERLLNK